MACAIQRAAVQAHETKLGKIDLPRERVVPIRLAPAGAGGSGTRRGPPGHDQRRSARKTLARWWLQPRAGIERRRPQIA